MKTILVIFTLVAAYFVAGTKSDNNSPAKDGSRTIEAKTGNFKINLNPHMDYMHPFESPKEGC